MNAFPHNNLPADRIPAHVDAVERDIAAMIVSGLIASGYALSVYDGEAFTVERSRDAGEVCGALATTDDGRILARDAKDRPAGWVRLIWGNGNALLSEWGMTVGARGLAFAAAVETLANEIDARFT